MGHGEGCITKPPERSPNTGSALSLETSSQFVQFGGGPTTTTTAPARYFLAVYRETHPKHWNGALARDFLATQAESDNWGTEGPERPRGARTTHPVEVEVVESPALELTALREGASEWR